MLTPGPCQSIRLHGRPEEGTCLERFDSTKMSFCGLRRVPSDAEIILSLLFSACSPNEHHCPASLWWRLSRATLRL